VEPVLAPPLLAACASASRGEQSLLLLNRRGYAPVLHCADCGWKSGCPHCSAWRVFHKADRTLRCHHCGFTERVPRACPDCGNLDIAPWAAAPRSWRSSWPSCCPAPASAASTPTAPAARARWKQQLAAVHAGEVDVLVGTQMVAKGHDFRRMTLVAAVNPDGALFSSDFRAPERLFALLMQAAGRAGRDAEQAARSEMWVQTWHPQHPLYQALRAARLRGLRRQPAGRAAHRRPAALCPAWRCCGPRHATRRWPRPSCRPRPPLAAGLPGAAEGTVYPPVPPASWRWPASSACRCWWSRPHARAAALLAAWLPALQALAQPPQGAGALGGGCGSAGDLKGRFSSASPLRPGARRKARRCR
jgi:primosomal protein N' (replication factor Y)